jgi:hypothetical protein
MTCRRKYVVQGTEATELRAGARLNESDAKRSLKEAFAPFSILRLLAMREPDAKYALR